MIRYPEMVPSREVERLARLLAGVGEEWGEEKAEEVIDEGEGGGYGFEGLVERLKGVLRRD